MKTSKFIKRHYKAQRIKGNAEAVEKTAIIILIIIIFGLILYLYL